MTLVLYGLICWIDFCSYNAVQTGSSVGSQHIPFRLASLRIQMNRNPSGAPADDSGGYWLTNKQEEFFQVKSFPDRLVILRTN